MPKKKKRNLGPRRKRMKRQGRLQSAKHWITSYNGSNIIKGYRNWFGVDFPCAIQELRTLGVKLNEQYVSQVLKSREQSILLKQKKIQEKKDLELENSLLDSDENFYFIAGYTSGGCPYGITWEDAEKLI